MAVKVAMIGAGSIGFTRKLMQDILTVPELEDTHFAFTDISKRNLDMVAQLARRDVKANAKPATITATTKRRAALDGADYVFCTIRAGGLEAFKSDIDIPLKYGVDQCVGDTLCPGGILYGQRGIPLMLDFCKDMREVSSSKVLFMNYANPMAMNTWACIKHGGVRTVGLCHGVHGAWEQIAEVLELPWAELDVICAGINHQTWFLSVKHHGKEMTGKFLEAFERHPKYAKTEKVRIDVLRRFGYYSTESNGHLSEYLPWYRKRPKEIRNWIKLGDWIDGETGGYLRVCTEERDWFEKEYANGKETDAPEYTPENRSAEHGSYIIEALETGRCYRGFFNVQNNGIIANLPPDCIVEAPGYVDGNGINMTAVGDLPLACAATCSASVHVQRMAMEAAVQGDVTLLKQAMLHDPLTGAVCNPPEVWQMADEMLVAQAKWLPQYKQEIPKARKRLDEEPPLGTQSTNGAARMKADTAPGKKTIAKPPKKPGQDEAARVRARLRRKRRR